MTTPTTYDEQLEIAQEFIRENAYQTERAMRDDYEELASDFFLLYRSAEKVRDAKETLDNRLSLLQNDWENSNQLFNRDVIVTRAADLERALAEYAIYERAFCERFHDTFDQLGKDDLTLSDLVQIARDGKSEE